MDDKDKDKEDEKKPADKADSDRFSIMHLLNSNVEQEHPITWFRESLTDQPEDSVILIRYYNELKEYERDNPELAAKKESMTSYLHALEEKVEHSQALEEDLNQHKQRNIALEAEKATLIQNLEQSIKKQNALYEQINRKQSEQPHTHVHLNLPPPNPSSGPHGPVSMSSHSATQAPPIERFPLQSTYYAGQVSHVEEEVDRPADYYVGKGIERGVPSSQTNQLPAPDEQKYEFQLPRITLTPETGQSIKTTASDFDEDENTSEELNQTTTTTTQPNESKTAPVGQNRNLEDYPFSSPKEREKD